MRKKKEIDLLEYGQTVTLGNRWERDIKAEITAICLRPTYIRYEVSWWKNGTYTQIWMSREEFTVTKDASKIKVGFYDGKR